MPPAAVGVRANFGGLELSGWARAYFRGRGPTRTRVERLGRSRAMLRKGD